jgi:Capsule assembly protein Wzi
MASWIGRQGRGGQGWATYWLSPNSKLQLTYRRQTVDRVFLEGGQLNDFGANGEFRIRPEFGISGSIQYEQWRFPLLQPKEQTNLSTSIELKFYPSWRSRKN